MKHLALAVALLLACPSFAAAQDFSGIYDVAGTGLDGRPYAGTAEISGVGGPNCKIFRTIEGVTVQGICMRYGPSFAAAYSAGNNIDLVIYQVMDDGSLSGIWTASGQTGSGTEVLTRR